MFLAGGYFTLFVKRSRVYTVPFCQGKRRGRTVSDGTVYLYKFLTISTGYGITGEREGHCTKRVGAADRPAHLSIGTYLNFCQSQ